MVYDFRCDFENTNEHTPMPMLSEPWQGWQPCYATDNTRYGEGRASPRSFLTHHVANISTAIQAADAQTILNAASARMLRVSFGVM